MMKGHKLFIAITCICVNLAISSPTGFAQDTTMTPRGSDFVPSPVFSTVYSPLPYHFNDVMTIQNLCKATKGAIKKALPLFGPTKVLDA